MITSILFRSEIVKMDSIMLDGEDKSLPPFWNAYYSEKRKMHYYCNSKTGLTQWEHPL